MSDQSVTKPFGNEGPEVPFNFDAGTRSALDKEIQEGKADTLRTFAYAGLKEIEEKSSAVRDRDGIGEAQRVALHGVALLQEALDKSIRAEIASVEKRIETFEKTFAPEQLNSANYQRARTEVGAMSDSELMEKIQSLSMRMAPEITDLMIAEARTRYRGNPDKTATLNIAREQALKMDYKNPHRSTEEYKALASRRDHLSALLGSGKLPSENPGYLTPPMASLIRIGGGGRMDSISIQEARAQSLNKPMQLRPILPPSGKARR